MSIEKCSRGYIVKIRSYKIEAYFITKGINLTMAHPPIIFRQVDSGQTYHMKLCFESQPHNKVYRIRHVEKNQPEWETWYDHNTQVYLNFPKKEVSWVTIDLATGPSQEVYTTLDQACTKVPHLAGMPQFDPPAETLLNKN